MTAKEIYNYVCHLGFNSEVESKDGYYAALNIAIEQVNKIRPIQKLLRIDRIKETPIITLSELERDTEGKYTAALTSEVGAASVYMECCGTCNVQINEGEIHEVVSTDSYSVLNVILEDTPNEITITAESDYVFKIRNIAVFGRLKGKDEAFEYGEYEEYDLGKITHERFDGLVKIESAPGVTVTPGDKVLVSRNRLRIACDDDTDYTVFYRARPKKITEDTLDDEDIEIDRESEFLVPLLTAYYVWLDDDPQKAAQYRNEYEMQKAELLKIQTLKNNKVRSNGW